MTDIFFLIFLLSIYFFDIFQLFIELSFWNWYIYCLRLYWCWLLCEQIIINFFFNLIRILLSIFFHIQIEINLVDIMNLVENKEQEKKVNLFLEISILEHIQRKENYRITLFILEKILAFFLKKKIWIFFFSEKFKFKEEKNNRIKFRIGNHNLIAILFHFNSFFLFARLVWFYVFLFISFVRMQMWFRNEMRKKEKK